LIEQPITSPRFAGRCRKPRTARIPSLDVFIGYRTNPHLDMRERGAEAAAAIREMGESPRKRRLRLAPPDTKQAELLE
jgi:Metallopeptidase family M81